MFLSRGLAEDVKMLHSLNSVNASVWTSSERVCNVCAKKVQNAVEMTYTDHRKSVLAKAKRTFSETGR